jgi:hypothetical protein
MSEIESDFNDYQNQRDAEGGLHDARTDPSRAVLWTAGAVVLLFLAGIAALVLVG